MEVEFSNVRYIYNQNTPLEKTALNDISITLNENKIHGIIGPSGSGKTTLVELINALLLPTKGMVTVGDFAIKPRKMPFNVNKLRFNVGLVFQFPEEQFFNSTVKKEIGFAMTYFQYKVKEIDKRVVDALKMVGLDESYLDRNPFYLSNGEKRKIAIASILVFNPQVIILDEPTVGLDYHGKKMLIKNIRMLRDKYNKTIIICTHDVDMLYPLVDNIIVLNKGQVLLEGNREEVFNQTSVLAANNIKIPRIVEFINKVNNKKGIKLPSRTDIKDLIKDIYRHV